MFGPRHILILNLLLYVPDQVLVVEFGPSRMSSVVSFTWNSGTYCMCLFLFLRVYCLRQLQPSRWCVWRIEIDILVPTNSTHSTSTVHHHVDFLPGQGRIVIFNCHSLMASLAVFVIVIAQELLVWWTSIARNKREEWVLLVLRLLRRMIVISLYLNASVGIWHILQVNTATRCHTSSWWGYYASLLYATNKAWLLALSIVNVWIL